MSGAQAELWPNLELVLDELDEREEDLFELEVEFEETSFDSNQFRRAALNGKNYQSLSYEQGEFREISDFLFFGKRLENHNQG